MLAAALAAKASRRIQQRVSGLQQIGEHVTVAELRIHPQSRPAGRSLVDLHAPERFGATIVGRWVEGEFKPGLSGSDRLEPGAIIVAIGGPEGVARLGEIATPLTQGGKIVVFGYGEVGHEVVELLNDAGKATCVVDVANLPGVDVVGNARTPTNNPLTTPSAGPTMVYFESQESAAWGMGRRTSSALVIARREEP